MINEIHNKRGRKRNRRSKINKYEHCMLAHGIFSLGNIHSIL
jgi:hypothetical protein